MKNLIKRLLFLKVLFIFFALALPQLHANEEGSLSNPNMSFSKIDLKAITINESDYFDFIRESIITQPEFLYAQSNFIEKNQSLKFAKDKDGLSFQ
jgi:hypothetical protein